MKILQLVPALVMDINALVEELIKTWSEFKKYLFDQRDY